MRLKSLVVTGLLAGLFGIAAIAPAEARSHVNFFVGVGPPVVYGGYPYAYPYYGYYPYEPNYEPYPVYRPGVSCLEGRDIVRGVGYRGVTVGDCRGAVYTYSGWRRGVLFRIKVLARTGRILSAAPV